MLEGLAQRAAAWARWCATRVLASRPVPQHVAFIMDGNRRYADRQHLRKVEGHVFGYQKLIQALEWCLDLGVRCVSVYAFSIDNYNRSQEEVDTLMKLAEDKLAHMMQEHDVLARHGIQVRVIGDLTLAPAHVRAAAAALMDATRHHDRAVLNICFSYTASEELARALDAMAAGACSSCGGGAASEDQPGCSPECLDRLLYTQGCPAVDLMIRTSGETRLSDFLLWQSRSAVLVFTAVLWPDLRFVDLAAAVVRYQWCASALRPRAAEQQKQQQRGARRWQGGGAEAPLPTLDLKLALGPARLGSPCGVASPGSPSSLSATSEELDGATATSEAEAGLRQRRRSLEAARGRVS